MDELVGCCLFLGMAVCAQEGEFCNDIGHAEYLVHAITVNLIELNNIAVHARKVQET